MASYKKGFQGNERIRGAGVAIEWDQHRLTEFRRCAAEPEHFIRNYIKILNLDSEELVLFDPRDYQMNMINTIRDNRFVIAKWSRQSGKCHCINTLVTTRNRLTGEVSERTVGEIYREVAQPIHAEQGATSSREDRGAEETVRGKDGGSALRDVRLLRVPRKGLVGSYQDAWNEGGGISGEMADDLRGAQAREESELLGRKEPRIPSRGEILTLVKEVLQEGSRRRGLEEKGCRERLSTVGRVSYEEVWSRRDRSEDSGLGASAHFQLEEVRGEIRREGGARALGGSSGEVAGYPSLQVGRGNKGHHSQKDDGRSGLGNRNSVRRGDEENLSGPGDPVRLAMSEKESSSLRLSAREPSDRVSRRFLARSPYEVQERRTHPVEQEARKKVNGRGGMGEGSREGGPRHLPGLRDPRRLGGRLQEGTHEGRPRERRLSDGVKRKFVDSRELSDVEVWTDSGWHPASSIHLTVPYEVYVVRTLLGRELRCADDHILFDLDMEETFVKDLVPGDLVRVEGGFDRVVSVERTGERENMYDMTVDSEDHRYFTNGFLSHNTTTAAAMLLWYVIFNGNFPTLILAHKHDKAREIIAVVQKMYEFLPEWLQHGVVSWAKGSFELENGSSVKTAGTSSSSGRGGTYALLLLDEFSFVPTHIADDFLKSVVPTISSGKSTKLVITSTPKGLNTFYRLWNDSINGKNDYARVDINWWDVPGRDEKWKEGIISSYGSEYFRQEYASEFLGSSRTLISGPKLASLVTERPLRESDHARTYADPVEGRTYVATVDVSEGLGADYSAVVVFDVTELPYRVVAVYRNNMIEPMALPGVVHELATRYNEALVLVEANFGQQVGEILYSELEYENMVFTTKGKSGPQAKVDRISSGYSGRSRVGLAWNAHSKRIGCSNLKTLVEQDQLAIVDEWIYDELVRFSVKGKSYAAEDGHDDLAMCLVMFAWMVDQGYVRDATDVDIRGRIARLNSEAIENDMMPLGFNSLNHEDVEMIVMERPEFPIDLPDPDTGEYPFHGLFVEEVARGGLSEKELNDAFFREFFDA